MLAPIRTSNGSLMIKATIAKPGIMTYSDGQGNTWRELIDETELHKSDSLRTLAAAPVTLDHPAEDVTPDNTQQLAIGEVTPEVEVDDDGYIRITKVIRRRDGIDAVLSGGYEECSPGYTCFVDFTPGTHPRFGDYDAVQRDRVYNHSAMVKQARGGSDIRARLDGAAVQVDRADQNTPAPDRASTARNPTMNPHLLTYASLLAVARKDAEGLALSEDQLAAAIMQAIEGMKAENAQMGEKVEAVEALPQSPEEMQAEIDRLKAENAELKAAAQERADQELAEAEAAETERLDGLAKRVKFDAAGWTEETTNTERRLDIARHAGLVDGEDTPADEVVAAKLDALDRLTAKQDSKPEAIRADGSSTDTDGVATWKPLALNADNVPASKLDGSDADKPKALDPFKANLMNRGNAEA